MTSLLNGTALITGAGSGIGQNTALAFAKHGITKLALADINREALNETISLISKQSPHVETLPLHMDVRDGAQVRDGIAEAVRRFGRLDIAVNNAGIKGSGKLTHEIEDDEIERVLDVNLHGVYRCQKEELAVMVKQEDLGPRDGRGRIINVASMYGLVAPNSRIPHTAYATAKHGVIGLTRGDANAYADYHIRINAICPGFVATPLLPAEFPDDNHPLAAEVKRSPLRRFCEMEEIADSIVSMASRMNSFMQGSAVVVDGGLSSS